jgi:hypothetical protein
MSNQPLREINKLVRKALKNLLKLYYFTYLERSIIPIGVQREPKNYPGVKATMAYLNCSEPKAKDYLKALKIIREHFVGYEVWRYTRRQVEITSNEEFNHLKAEVGKDLVNGVKASQLNKETVRRQLELEKADQFFMKAIERISKTKKAYTGKQFAELIKQFTSIII